MSVTLKQVVWSRIGAITSEDYNDFTSLRVSPYAAITYSTPSVYKRWSVFYPPFRSQLAETVDLPGNLTNKTKCLPLELQNFGNNDFAYRTNDGIYVNIDGQNYTFSQQTNNEIIYGFDATTNRHIAFCARSQGQTSQGVSYNENYISWGQLIGYDINIGFSFQKKYTTYNIDFTGECSLSRNGAYCVVFGIYNSEKAIAVFKGDSGSGAVRVGANFTLPDSTLYSVKINNSGTRVVAIGLTTIRTYDLIAGSWSQVGATINFLPLSEIPKISLSEDGTILIHRNSFFLDTFSWGGNWEKLNRIEIPSPNSNYEVDGDISEGAEYLVFNIWSEPSAQAVEVYKSTISEVTYYAPEIIAGQEFNVIGKVNFSETPSVLADDLNREITEWSAIGLPQGLSINVATGLISGLATAEGSFTATITARGPGGTSTKTITLLVSFIFKYGTSVATVYAGTTPATAVYYGSQMLWSSV